MAVEQGPQFDFLAQHGFTADEQKRSETIAKKLEKTHTFFHNALGDQIDAFNQLAETGDESHFEMMEQARKHMEAHKAGYKVMSGTDLVDEEGFCNHCGEQVGN